MSLRSKIKEIIFGGGCPSQVIEDILAEVESADNPLGEHIMRLDIFESGTDVTGSLSYSSTLISPNHFEFARIVLCKEREAIAKAKAEKAEAKAEVDTMNKAELLLETTKRLSRVLARTDMRSDKISDTINKITAIKKADIEKNGDNSPTRESLLKVLEIIDNAEKEIAK